MSQLARTSSVSATGMDEKWDIPPFLDMAHWKTWPLNPLLHHGARLVLRMLESIRLDRYRVPMYSQYIRSCFGMIPPFFYTRCSLW